MYMRECEHRVYEVEIGDGGGITRKRSLGRQGRVSAEATRYALRGTVSPRRVSDAPGGYWLARCGGRVTLARPPVLRVAFPPGGLGGRGGRRCDRHQGTGEAIVQEYSTVPVGPYRYAGLFRS